MIGLDALHAFTKPGWRLRYVERVASTNDLAHEAGLAGEAEGLVIVAEEQTAGRGRMQRAWAAPPGTCLLMSLLFRPAEPFAHHAPRLTMLCGLSLIEALRECDPSLAARLKWPNDLIITRPTGAWRKLAGMLSEVGLEEAAPTFLVVGIGLNVNVPPDVLPALAPNATSLLAETGRPCDRAALLDTFLARVTHHATRWRAGTDPAPAWRAHLAWRGERVTVHTSTGVTEGVLEDVDATGALLLRHPDGTRQCFTAGDVSLRRPTSLRS